MIARTLYHIQVEGKYDKQTKVNEEEAKAIVQDVYKIVEQYAKGDLSIGAPPPSIGILSVGGPKQVECIQKLLTSTLKPLDLKYFDDTIEKHNIIVREVAEIQGDERDVILISCVYDSASVPKETGEESIRIWNVASTRHKKQSRCYASFDPAKLERGDHKRKFLASYMGKNMDSEVISWKPEERDVRLLAEKKLHEALLEEGFQLKRNSRCDVWKNALVVGVNVNTESSINDFGSSINDRCAYLYVGNHGESDEEWNRMVVEQQEWEQAGIACMRLDVLDLVLYFEERMTDIRRFLTEAGLDPRMAVATTSTVGTCHRGRNSPEDAIVAAIPPDFESDLTSSQHSSSASTTSISSSRPPKRQRRGAGTSTGSARKSQKAQTTTATSGTDPKRGRRSDLPISKATKKSRTKK